MRDVCFVWGEGAREAFHAELEGQRAGLLEAAPGVELTAEVLMKATRAGEAAHEEARRLREEKAAGCYAAQMAGLWQRRLQELLWAGRKESAVAFVQAGSSWFRGSKKLAEIVRGSSSRGAAATRDAVLRVARRETLRWTRARGLVQRAQAREALRFLEEAAGGGQRAVVRCGN